MTYPQMPATPAPENKGKETWKVIRLQLLIFAGYQAGLGFLVSIFHAGSFIMVDMLPLLAHWFVLLILMIISFGSRKPGRGLGYLISLVITMIVGFGSCFMIGDLVDRGYSFF